MTDPTLSTLIDRHARKAQNANDEQTAMLHKHTVSVLKNHETLAIEILEFFHSYQMMGDIVLSEVDEQLERLKQSAEKVVGKIGDVL